MKVLLVMIFFFIVIPTASAYSGVFDILNEKAYDDSLDVVTEYKAPDKTVQESEHIRGWIDIIGFKKTVRLDVVVYSNVSEPIVQYDYWADNFGEDDHLDKLEFLDQRLIIHDGSIISEVDIHLNYHHSTKIITNNTFMVPGIKLPNTQSLQYPGS